MSELKLNFREIDADVAYSENLYNEPLPNSIIDKNFKFLNRNKIDTEGIIPVEKISFKDDDTTKNPNITYDDVNNTISINNASLKIGELTIEPDGGIELESTTGSNTLRIASESSTYTELVDNNVGLVFGDETSSNLASIILTSAGWRFRKNPNDTEKIIAKDFVTDEEISLNQLNSDFTDLSDNLFVETSPENFNANDSLKDAIIALDTQVNTNKDDITSYNDQFDELEALKRFIISKEVFRDNSGVLEDVGTFYRLAPQASGLVYFLPEDYGAITIKLINDNSFKLKVHHANSIEANNTIENEEEITVDVRNLTIRFIRNNVNEPWRIM